MDYKTLKNRILLKGINAILDEIRDSMKNNPISEVIQKHRINEYLIKIELIVIFVDIYL